jgi:SAM-dependent methyltransferase
VPSSSPFLEFAGNYLPSPPARVLDVGCGQGELTTALAVAGYDVLGIDPLAPHGDLFRRLRLEDLETTEPFDGVVAGFSLHHLRDLDAGLDKIAGLLPTGGVLVVDEFGWDRLDETTLDWFYGQLRALAAAGHGKAPASHDELRQEWEAEHLGLHGFAALREGLGARFDEQELEWVPHLYRTLAGVATEVLEQALIDAGAIQPLGFRWAGVARPR